MHVPYGGSGNETKHVVDIKRSYQCLLCSFYNSYIAGVPPPSPLFKTVPVPKLPEPNFKPLKPQKVVKKKGGNSSSDDEEDELILWVQCDNKSCRKWRKISPDSKVDLSGQWYCHMHPDPHVRSCKAPEENWKVSRKRTFTFSRFSPGQLVWAKLSGYPP